MGLGKKLAATGYFLIGLAVTGAGIGTYFQEKTIGPVIGFVVTGIIVTGICALCDEKKTS